MVSHAKGITLQLEKKEQISRDIHIYYFSSKETFDFLPGQYLQMHIPHEKKDDRGSNRFFTIASSPSEKYIMITSHRGESTFKGTLFNLSIGTEVLCFGPMGSFVLDSS